MSNIITKWFGHRRAKKIGQKRLKWFREHSTFEKHNNPYGMKGFYTGQKYKK